MRVLTGSHDAKDRLISVTVTAAKSKSLINAGFTALRPFSLEADLLFSALLLRTNHKSGAQLSIAHVAATLGGGWLL